MGIALSIAAIAALAAANSIAREADRMGGRDER